MNGKFDEMDIEWDEDKNSHNRKAHKISFEEAVTVFYDELSIIINDPDHSLDEQRFLIIGESSAGRLHVVSYTERGKKIRLISARKTTRTERKNYEETKQ